MGCRRVGVGMSLRGWRFQRYTTALIALFRNEKYLVFFLFIQSTFVVIKYGRVLNTLHQIEAIVGFCVRGR